MALLRYTVSFMEYTGPGRSRVRERVRLLERLAEALHVALDGRP
jgi:hypothetical protein